MYEGRSRSCAGVLEPGKRAVTATGDEVQIAIAVQVCQCWGAVVTRINTVKGIVRAAALREIGGRGRTGVLDIGNSAVIVPVHQIQIAIIIQVGKYGRTVKVCGKAVQWIGNPRAQGKFGVAVCAGVLKIMKVSLVVADGHIGVAVTVEVGKCLCVVGKQGGIRHIGQDEGIGFAGPQPEELAQVAVHVGPVAVDGISAVALFGHTIQFLYRNDIHDHGCDYKGTTGINIGVQMLFKS